MLTLGGLLYSQGEWKSSEPKGEQRLGGAGRRGGREGCSWSVLYEKI